MDTQSLKKILDSSVQERLEAVETIWDSIDSNLLPVADEELAIAKERYQEYISDPTDVIGWENVKQGLMRKYGF